MSTDTIINCYRKTIDNAMLYYKNLLLNQLTNKEKNHCYDENEDIVSFLRIITRIAAIKL